MIENELSLKEELISKQDSIFRGRSLLLGVFSIYIFIYIFMNLGIVYISSVDYDIHSDILIGLTLAFFIISTFLSLVIYISCYQFYKGTEVGKSSYFSCVFIFMSLAMKNIPNSFLTMDIRQLIGCIYAVILIIVPGKLVSNSKNIKEFLCYQVEIKNDSSLKIKLEEDVKNIYSGRTIVIISACLCICEALGILSYLLINIFENYKNIDNMTYINCFIQIAISICMFMLYKKKMEIQPIIFLFIIRLLLNLRFLLTLHTGLPSLIVEVIHTIIILIFIIFLMIKKSKVDLYIESEVL